MKKTTLLLSVSLGLALTASAGGYYIETNEIDRVYTLVSTSAQPVIRETLTDLDGQPWKVMTRAETGSDLVFFLFPTNGPSTYSGGLVMTGGQVRVTAEGAGRGPITLLNGSNIIACDAAGAPSLVDLTNSVFFGRQDSYATSTSFGRSLRLHAVQTGEKNTAREVRLGRTTAGSPSSVQLALDGAENGAIGYFGLQGDLRLVLDGGTVKIAEGTTGNIFRLLSTATPALSQTPSTTTFEIANGADVALGYPIEPAPVTTNVVVLEAVCPKDYGFETGLGDWKGGYVEDATVSDTNTATRQNNGSSFLPKGYPDYYTTNGNWAVMLRRQSYLQTTVTIPSDGDWRVVFDCGCRADDGVYSKNMPIKVLVDGVTVTEFEPSGKLFTFKRFASDPVRLTAGSSHTVRLETGMTSQNWDCINFDCIRLERTTEVEARSIIRKTGAGTLTLDQYPSNATYQVAEGVLTADFLRAAETTVKVASGTTLALTDGETNLVANGSFEQGTQGKDLLNAAPSQWTRGWTVETDANKSGPGVQGNGGNVSPANLGPVTPVGTFTAALREYTYIEQVVTVPEDGKYYLAFLQSCRRSPEYRANSLLLQVRASVGGVTVVEVGSHAALYDYERHGGEVELKKGEQTVRFEVTNGTKQVGPLVYIDDVRLVRSSAEREVPLKIDLEPGSALSIDTFSPYRLLGLTVGGEEIRSKQDLTQKGVALTVTGRAKIGARRGLLMLVK